MDWEDKSDSNKKFIVAPSFRPFGLKILPENTERFDSLVKDFADSTNLTIDRSRSFINRLRVNEVDSKGRFAFRKSVREFLEQFFGSEEWFGNMSWSGHGYSMLLTHPELFLSQMEINAKKRRTIQSISLDQRRSMIEHIRLDSIESRSYDLERKMHEQYCSHLFRNMMTKVITDPSLLYRISPIEFEQFTGDLFQELGYDVESTPVSNDEGVDLFVKMPTQFGELQLLVECKRYSVDRPISVEILRSVYGALNLKNASAAIIVTTSTFTKPSNSLQDTIPFRLKLMPFGKLLLLINKAYSSK